MTIARKTPVIKDLQELFISLIFQHFICPLLFYRFLTDQLTFTREGERKGNLLNQPFKYYLRRAVLLYKEKQKQGPVQFYNGSFTLKTLQMCSFLKIFGLE